jgi:hypothetical protein
MGLKQLIEQKILILCFKEENTDSTKLSPKGLMFKFKQDFSKHQ